MGKAELLNLMLSSIIYFR